MGGSAVPRTATEGWEVPGDPSQFSHGLAGRYGTKASIPDARQDADLRFWIAEPWPDRFH